MNQNIKIFLWALSAALGGFLFGFDTAVISGVEQTLQKLWNLNVVEHGVTVSIALIGTVLGSLIGGLPAEKYGRRITLLLVAIFYLLSSLGTAYAANWSIFLVFRFLGGLGVGVSSVVAPMYISEIAPAHKRGRLVAMFQFNVVFGILIAYLSNYLLADIGENAWRWMLGVQALPSILFLVTVFIIPESPRWLILKKGDVATARKTLEEIDTTTSEEIIEAIRSHAATSVSSNFTTLFKPTYSKPVMLAVLFAVFNQVSGINAIIYFAPRIFEMAGLGKDSALLSSAGIGLINLVSTLLGISLIDKFGRKVLMFWGSIGLIGSLILVAQAFFSGNIGLNVSFYLFIFIAFFGFSQGAVIWVFISEIFPNEVRAYGQALGSFTHWILAAIITFTFPYIAETFGGGVTFTFFASMMVLQLLFVLKIMPETKGTSLEGMEKTIVMH
ncbi:MULTISPECIES: sugar porter family MFS transporter [unclassified Arcicella]|uniref:sugar porter family MFS transporter n=1 Tax=unclassified Arcicella TaxID=2644986 RepID=UPI002859043A|nr:MULTISPECIES: sugar porter family MFS transporter [unclassified Arcicella]MDR6562347.1 sugar porter (SP) family MFS transporter [Arcicella sp. BE51]MDR6812241.1 sugar porter (SP) family MFS transporter [Arcicella sp. BE140]MDR6823572.1 sugar porter (SP) family MFS transporter [Arcicella sp. BE139]